MTTLRYFALAICLYFWGLSRFFAQCPPGNVSLLSQADVNTFVATYPSCTTISGFLQIGDSFTDINNLSGLSALTTISGSLIVQGNPNLLNLNGLHNITTIGDELVVVDNSSLINLTGLGGLTTITGNIVIESNAMLEDLSGLSALVQAGGLSLIDNPVLVSLDGLETLTSVALVVIVLNPVLADLSGIAQIDPNVLVALRIEDNSMLSACAVTSICDYLQNMGMNIITDNDTGCNSAAEVLAACAAMPVEWLWWRAMPAADGTFLEWGTGIERESAGFEIKRSGDGVSWAMLGFVASRGSYSRYAWHDHSPLTGANYYRLKQIDTDGTVSFSPIRQVWRMPALSALAPRPNPARDRVLLPDSAQRYVLFDLTGSMRSQGVAESSEADLRGLPAGMYMLQVWDNGGARMFPLAIID